MKEDCKNMFRSKCRGYPLYQRFGCHWKITRSLAINHTIKYYSIICNRYENIQVEDAKVWRGVTSVEMESEWSIARNFAFTAASCLIQFFDHDTQPGIKFWVKNAVTTYLWHVTTETIQISVAFLSMDVIRWFFFVTQPLFCNRAHCYLKWGGMLVHWVIDVSFYNRSMNAIEIFSIILS